MQHTEPEGRLPKPADDEKYWLNTEISYLSKENK